MKTSFSFAFVAFASYLLSAASQSVLENIVFNEVLPDPTGVSNFDTDCDGVGDDRDEFVEIYNTNSEDIDVGGLQFWSPSSDNFFTVPDGTILGGNGFLVVVADTEGGYLPLVAAGSHAFSAEGSFSLSNVADELVLYDPTTDQYIQAYYNNDSVDDPTGPESPYDGFSVTATRLGDIFNFGQDFDGASIARNPDGSENVQTHNNIGDGSVFASPGSSNTGPGMVCGASNSPTLAPTPAPTSAPTASPTVETCPCRGRFRVLCRVLNLRLCFPWEG